MEQIDERTEKAGVRLLSEERINEILRVLFPFGYGKTWPTRYAGPVPCYGSDQNMMEVIVNEPDYGSKFEVFHLVLHSVGGDVCTSDMFGYYVGVMNIIAPELQNVNISFNLSSNVLDFEFRPDDELERNPWKNIKVWL